MRKTWLLSAAIGARYGPGTGGVRDRGTERGAVLPGNGCAGPDLGEVDGGAAENVKQTETLMQTMVIKWLRGLG